MNSNNWYDKNGTIEWKSLNGSLYVEIQHGRRYLKEKGRDDSLAEQVSSNGKKTPVEKWVKQKIKERSQSTGKYVQKLKEQLAKAEKDHKEWVERSKLV